MDATSESNEVQRLVELVQRAMVRYAIARLTLAGKLTQAEAEKLRNLPVSSIFRGA